MVPQHFRNNHFRGKRGLKKVNHRNHKEDIQKSKRQTRMARKDQVL